MSKTLKLIQNRLGVSESEAFNRETARAIMHFFQLSPIEGAHFLGQFHHETGGFKSFEENLNYTSAERILAVFPRYFKGGIEEAMEFVRNPEKLANRVYSNRMGNGDESSGDGWKYRGRGKPHLTGKNNYIDFANWMNEPRILNNPDIVSDDFAMDAGLYYFERNGLFKHCKNISDSNILEISRGVNVGNINSSITPHGMNDRIVQTRRMLEWLS